MDLFGSETSSNVAAYYTAGLKGRWMETRRKDDHQLHDQTMDVPIIENGRMGTKTVPMLTALNLDLRNEYVADCANGVKRWNQELEDAGLEERLVPAAPGVQPQGRLVRRAPRHARPARSSTRPTWERTVGDYLPTPDDRAQVAELMVPHYEPGEFAGWIAPPSVGINSLPVEYDYVRF